MEIIEKEDYIKEFSNQKDKYFIPSLISGIICILSVVALLFSSLLKHFFNTNLLLVILSIMFISMTIMFIYHFKVLKCPRCNKYLGKYNISNYCSNCGVILRNKKQ